MLTSLRIQSFKAFTDATVPISGLTVLIGPNGTGKSTILHAVELLGGLTQTSIRDFLDGHGWEYSDLPHLRGDNQRFGVMAAFDDEVTWALELATRRRPGVGVETVTAPTHGFVLMRSGREMRRLDQRTGEFEGIKQTLTSSWISVVDPNDRDDQRRFPVLVRLAAWARGIRGYYFLDPIQLRKPARNDSATDIGRSGESLTSFLAALRGERKKLARLVERVQQHYPRLVGLDVVKREGELHLELKEKWGRSSASFNARQVSDGLLRLLAISALHELPDPPTMLLLDEIEDGLHPGLLGGVMRMLQDLVNEREGRTQVMLTTHSPLTVNFCDSADQVLLVHRDAKGAAAVKPLSKAKGYPELSAHFDLGELWYNVGEERLLRS